MNASLVVNPASGNISPGRIHAIETLLRKKIHLETFITEKRGDACEFARSADNVQRIIIAGGDGTINEVVNGVMTAGLKKGDAPSLAILPLGTANVLAKELSVPGGIEEAVDCALAGNSRSISLGRINGRFFTLMAGAGFDGETVRGVRNAWLKKIFPKAPYILSGIRALRNYCPPLIEIRTPEGVFSGYTAVVANARFYGGYYSVAPRASITEPALDICMLRSGTRKDMLRFIAGVIRKKHLGDRDITYFKSREMEVTARGKVHVQVDGDYFGTLPAKIDAIQDGVDFVVPAVT